MCSDLCSKSRGIRGATQNFTYFFNALLVLTLSTTNLRSRGEFIRNSRIQDCGTSNNLLPIRTGTYVWTFTIWSTEIVNQDLLHVREYGELE